ncbi:MAG TPA: hypothetical protein DEP69_03855 [Acidimicrobiaceae bacterium]|nr:hypothetical protein [Acidimicrobiaceae bacterium]
MPLSRPQLGDVDVLLRPEQLRLTRAPDGDGGAVGTVDLVEYYGHDAMAVVGLDGGQLRVRCEPDVPLRRGDRVAVHFAGSTAAGFPALDGGADGTAPAVPARSDEAQPRPRRPVAVPLAAD